MSITINGEVHANLPAQLTLAGLLTRLGLSLGKIAVERNLEIVPKSRYNKTVLAEGDRLEIITFIGGG